MLTPGSKPDPPLQEGPPRVSLRCGASSLLLLEIVFLEWLNPGLVCKEADHFPARRPQTAAR